MQRIFALLMSLFFINATFAQVQRQVIKKASADSVRNEKQKMKTSLKSLNLTREQRGKLKEIKQQNKADKEAIENDATLSDEQKQEKVKALKKEHSGKVKNLLTGEQKNKLKEMRRNKKGNQ